MADVDDNGVVTENKSSVGVYSSASDDKAISGCSVGSGAMEDSEVEEVDAVASVVHVSCVADEGVAGQYRIVPGVGVASLCDGSVTDGVADVDDDGVVTENESSVGVYSSASDDKAIGGCSVGSGAMEDSEVEEVYAVASVVHVSSVADESIACEDSVLPSV